MKSKSTMKTVLRAVKAVLGATVGLALLLLIIAWMLGAFHEKIEPGQSGLRCDRAPAHRPRR